VRQFLGRSLALSVEGCEYDRELFLIRVFD
jgi:hypothetical protein